MIFKELFTIPSYLADRHDRLQMWGCARLLQEVAEHHTSATHIGFHDLIKDNKAWVLSRMFYQINRRPSVSDNVMLNTWSRGTDGLFALREFDMCDEKGSTLVSATAYWVVIDYTKRRVTRLHEIMEGYEHHDCCATDRVALGKIPAQDFSSNEPVATIPIKDSMLDHTNHVNNSEYIKWIFDNLPEGLSSDQIQSIEIDYIGETQPNDIVKIFRSLNENSIFFQISNSRGVSITAKLLFLS